MTDKEIITKFKTFTNPEKETRLGQIAFSGTSVYATDGRLAVDGRLEVLHSEEVPEKYPIKSLREILGAPRANQNWFAIRFAEFELLDQQFKEAYKAEWQDRLRNYRTRYTEEECPCCGETVYWDSWDEKLVKEKEEMSDFDPREVEKSTLVRFTSGESVLVNFCYLHLLVQAFGRDIRLAIGHCTDEKNPMLHIRTADARVYGVLMPLRSYGGDFRANFILNVDPV